MSSNNFFTLSVRAKSRKKSKRINKLFCFFLVLVLVLNFLYINDNDSIKNYNYALSRYRVRNSYPVLEIVWLARRKTR